MKTRREYISGARHAWQALDRGITPDYILRIFDNRDDDYHLGWIAQAEDPDTELCPPDFPEPPDYSLHRGLCTGVAITGLAACIGAGVKYGVANPFTWLLAIVALLLLVRASRIPA